MKTQPGMIGMMSPTKPMRMSPTPPAMRRIFFRRVPSFASLTHLENFYLSLFATQILLLDALCRDSGSTIGLR